MGGERVEGSAANSAARVERRHRRQAAITALGVGGLALGVLLLEDSRTTIPQWEQDLFEWVNGWDDALERPALVVMQLGNFWVIPIVSGALLVARKSRAALSVAVAGLSAWGLAKLVKQVVERGRPVELLDHVHVREHGITGLGFVSGHTATAFAVATALFPWLPGRWRWVPLTLASVVGVARIYVGAHLPLDVLGGAGLGIACGAVANWAVGTHVAPGDTRTEGTRRGLRCSRRA